MIHDTLDSTTNTSDTEATSTEVIKLPREGINQVQIDQLKSHPLQSQVFSDLPDNQLQDLADDIRVNGLREPIEILPDKTIVCGHQRVRAAILLGWTTIDAKVNNELAEAGEAEIERRFLTDNLHRRQLDRLEQARCYERMVALNRDISIDLLRRHEPGRIRDQVGEAMNLSGRTLDRYVRVLRRTPLEVQEAFRGGTLRLISAEAVAGLSAEIQREIARRIEGGEDPEAVVKAARDACRKRNHRKVGGATKFVRDVEKALERLGEPGLVYLTQYESEMLHRAKQVIDVLMTPPDDEVEP